MVRNFGSCIILIACAFLILEMSEGITQKTGGITQRTQDIKTFCPIVLEQASVYTEKTKQSLHGLSIKEATEILLKNKYIDLETFRKSNEACAFNKNNKIILDGNKNEYVINYDDRDNLEETLTKDDFVNWSIIK